jgi:formate-dependent phosphoribosylglycinamide formyltransferase (GAR transformylase)
MSVKIGTPLSPRAKKVLLCGSGELGKGLLGVELFIKGDEVIFREVSARPHDTGLVTLVSQDLSEFAPRARKNLLPGQAT